MDLKVMIDSNRENLKFGKEVLEGILDKYVINKADREEADIAMLMVITGSFGVGEAYEKIRSKSEEQGIAVEELIKNYI